LDLLDSHVNAGFGLLFADRGAAEKYLQPPVAPAPLGTVSKLREEGTTKHRVILDLRANSVNLASSTPERQVLPTPFQHGQDIALLGEALAADPDASLWSLVLDVQDALMGVPLAPVEFPFNCCDLGGSIKRVREPLYPDEPASGSFVVWAVLGFGGKPNPLIISRVIAFAARTGQALFRPDLKAFGCHRAAPARMQMYVDDPVATFAGSDSSCREGVDLLICWWLSLGLPLAWEERGFHKSPPHLDRRDLLPQVGSRLVRRSRDSSRAICF